MKRIPYYYLLIVAWLLSLQTATAQSDYSNDTLEVHFRVGQSDLDLQYADNEEKIESFVNGARILWGNRDARELQLEIYAGASPEGPAELNRRLGEQRGIALRKELLKRLNGMVSNITVVNQGARWGALYDMVEQSDEPWRLDVLEILGKRPESDTWQTDRRETQLKKLKGGTVWNALNERYLPVLRSSGLAIIAPLPDERLCCGTDTIVIRDTIVYLPEACPQYEAPIDLDPAWAIKTNLLLWGVVAPNIQVERSLGSTNRWSIEGEFFCPWWIWSHNTHAEQCLNAGVELRYWLGNRQKHHTLDGWHIGLGAAVGYYDFEWKRSEGYQGEYANVYCNFGYQHRFGRRNQWAVDGGIALGYIPTKYRHYLGSTLFPVGHEEEYDDHLMWQDTGWKHIIGATHINFTIAYIIGAKKSNRKNPEER